jgi:pectinesterase
MKIFVGMLAIVAVCGFVVAAEPSSDRPKWKKVLPATPDTLTEHRGLTCAKHGDRAVLLDLYVPKAEGPFPAILLIHGGGWRHGQVEADKPLAERLSGEAKYPAALDDCKAAVRWMRAHAAQYKIEPERFGVMGGSAGGHLSGLLAMTSDKSEFEGKRGSDEQSSAVKACVIMAASADLVAANREKTNEAALQFFGSSCQENPQLYASASPITHVGPNSPPTLFIEGQLDTPKAGSPEMREKLKQYGVFTELVTLKDAPHPFWMSQPWLDETVACAVPFLDRFLKDKNR